MRASHPTDVADILSGENKPSLEEVHICSSVMLRAQDKKNVDSFASLFLKVKYIGVNIKV